MQFRIIHKTTLAQALVNLEHECFHSDRLSKKQFIYFINSKTAKVVGLFNQKNLIGYAIICFRKNSDAARLYSFALHHAYQSQGVGRKFYTYLEKLISKTGYRKIKLEVHLTNLKAQNFYIKNNYKPFGRYENFYEDGSSALRMQKIL